MRKAAEAADVANDGVLSQIGRGFVRLAELYAGCSGYCALEGDPLGPPRGADEPADCGTPQPLTRQDEMRAPLA